MEMFDEPGYSRLTRATDANEHGDGESAVPIDRRSAISPIPAGTVRPWGSSLGERAETRQASSIRQSYFPESRDVLLGEVGSEMEQTSMEMVDDMHARTHIHARAHARTHTRAHMRACTHAHTATGARACAGQHVGRCGGIDREQRRSVCTGGRLRFGAVHLVVILASTTPIRAWHCVHGSVRCWPS